MSVLSGFEFEDKRYLDVTPYSKVMILKVVDKNGKAKAENVADAVFYAVNNGATIINISLGVWVDSIKMHESINYAISNEIL